MHSTAKQTPKKDHNASINVTHQAHRHQANRTNRLNR